jgi:hypothetical protein
MRLVAIAGLIGAAMLLGACSTTLKPATINPNTGYFPTASKISRGGVETQEPFDAKYLALLYVKTDSKSEKFNDFYVRTFKSMNKFNQVLTQGELEQLIIDRGLSKQIGNISDRIGLINASGALGPFIVVEPTVEWTGGYNYVSSLIVTDAQTGRVVLKLTNKAFNWAGLDEPLFYPLFNGFLSWTKNEPIQTEK